MTRVSYQTWRNKFWNACYTYMYVQNFWRSKTSGISKDILQIIAKRPNREYGHFFWTCFKSLIIAPMNLIFFVQVWEIGWIIENLGSRHRHSPGTHPPGPISTTKKQQKQQIWAYLVSFWYPGPEWEWRDPGTWEHENLRASKLVIILICYLL